MISQGRDCGLPFSVLNLIPLVGEPGFVESQLTLGQFFDFRLGVDAQLVAVLLLNLLVPQSCSAWFTALSSWATGPLRYPVGSALSTVCALPTFRSCRPPNFRDRSVQLNPRFFLLPPWGFYVRSFFQFSTITACFGTFTISPAWRCLLGSSPSDSSDERASARRLELPLQYYSPTPTSSANAWLISSLDHSRFCTRRSAARTVSLNPGRLNPFLPLLLARASNCA